MARQKKKFNLYNFFHEKDGKGVEKNSDVNLNFKHFFPLYFRKFTSLVATNVFFLIGNFPIIFFLLAISGLLNKTDLAPTNAMYPFLYGVSVIDASNPLLSVLQGVIGVQGNVSVPSVFTYICYCFSALLIFTFGPVTAITTRFLRSMVRAEPIFYRHDSILTLKTNWKQSILIGIIDLLAIFALLYGALFYWMNFGTIVLFAFLVLAALYSCMRFYLYLMHITFRLSIKKLFKNALIFVSIGWKRNLLGLLGILTICIFNYCLLMVYYPIGLLLPLILTVSSCAFIAMYAAYPTVKTWMIDPITAKKTVSSSPITEVEQTPLDIEQVQTEKE